MARDLALPQGEEEVAKDGTSSGALRSAPGHATASDADFSPIGALPRPPRAR